MVADIIVEQTSEIFNAGVLEFGDLEMKPTILQHESGIPLIRCYGVEIEVLFRDKLSSLQSVSRRRLLDQHFLWSSAETGMARWRL